MEDNKDLTSILEVPNGPYIIEGEFTITHKDGKKEVLSGSYALCRCGHSKRKPFCDGTHRKINFEKGEE